MLQSKTKHIVIPGKWYSELFVFVLLWSSVANAATVRLLWDRNPEPDVVEYRVYVGQSSRTYSSVVSAGNDTVFSVTNLDASHHGRSLDLHSDRH